MKKLYIDFDGVILDTIKTTYKLMEEAGVDKTNLKDTRVFYRNLDWKETLKNTPEINHSIERIKQIIASKKFDVSVLTHIVSYREGLAKIDYLKKRISNLSIILVPKEFSKTTVVNPKDSILIDDYTGNLQEWKQAGGVGIKFSKDMKENPFPVIDDLCKILDLTIDD